MTIQLSDRFDLSRLFRFTLPSIVMMLVTSIYSVVDGLFVSNLVGDQALAAVNIVYPLVMIVGAFGFMLGAGGSAEVAKARGLGEDQLAKEYFTNLIITVVVGGAILAGACLLFQKPLLGVLGANEALMRDCIAYGTIMLAGAPIFLLQTSCQSFLVVAERPKMGLGLAIGAGVTNMLLDYVFIALFRWGVAGAAAATVCGYVVGGLVPLFYFLSKNKSPLRLVKAKPHLRMLGKSCTNGISELMTNVSASLVTVLYNRQLMAAAGQQGVAAYTVMMYVNFVFAAALIGFSMGSAPIFSYQYGADDKAGLQGMFKICIKVILVLAVVMEVLAQLLGETLSAIFVGYNDALREMTASGFHVFALAFLFNGMNIFGSAFFTALGDGLVSGILSFLRTLVFACGAVLLFSTLFGLAGIWWAPVAAEGAAFLVTIAFFLGKRKKYGYA